MISRFAKLLGLLPNRAEALLVQQIDKALLASCATQHIPYISYLPESNQQNFRNLNKFCGDIVSTFGNVSALILEVKIRRSTGNLSAFDEEQHQGLKLLSSKSVPVFYSFNLVALDAYTRDCEQNLGVTAAVSPGCITSSREYPDVPDSLKSVVDALIKSPLGGGNIALVLAALIEPTKSLMNSGIGNLTTEKLLIAYNPDAKSLHSFSRQQILHILRSVFDEKFEAKDKTKPELAKAVKDMLDYLSKAVEKQATMKM